MPVLPIVSGALRSAAAGRRPANTIRRAIVVCGATGVVVAAAAATAEPALAGIIGSEPGNVKFSPASGSVQLQPTWSTKDGCPTSNRQSAQMSIFDPDGRFLSHISPVAYDVNGAFSGSLDGTLAAILRWAQVRNGKSLEFVIGCYSQVGGTGSVVWLQSTSVTLSSDGNSYTSSVPSGQQVTPTGPGAIGSDPGAAPGASAAAAAAAAAAHAGAGIGTPALAGLVTGSCALAAGIAGVLWYRRRDRSRLM
jgi:hypothetical protein